MTQAFNHSNIITMLNELLSMALIARLKMVNELGTNPAQNNKTEKELQLTWHLTLSSTMYIYNESLITV